MQPTVLDLQSSFDGKPLLSPLVLDDIQEGWVAGLFGGWIYLVPSFTGALADRTGFRKALLMAFALLTLSYGTLGVFHTMAPVGVGLADTVAQFQ